MCLGFVGGWVYGGGGRQVPAGSDVDPQVGAFVCVWVLWVAGLMGRGGGRLVVELGWVG